MKEIEVGEYVRTKDGYIFKIVDIDNIFIYVDKEVRYIGETNTSIDYIKKSSVVKHSKNIIDLLKVEDFANGYKIIKINYKDKWIVIQNINEFGENGKKVLLENEIETILTKEQYMQNCYTVERRENGD